MRKRLKLRLTLMFYYLNCFDDCSGELPSQNSDVISENQKPLTSKDVKVFISLIFPCLLYSFSLIYLIHKRQQWKSHKFCSRFSKMVFRVFDVSLASRHFSSLCLYVSIRVDVENISSSST